MINQNVHHWVWSFIPGSSVLHCPFVAYIIYTWLWCRPNRQVKLSCEIWCHIVDDGLLRKTFSLNIEHFLWATCVFFCLFFFFLGGCIFNIYISLLLHHWSLWHWLLLFQIITWGAGMAYIYSDASQLAPSPNRTIGNVFIIYVYGTNGTLSTVSFFPFFITSFAFLCLVPAFLERVLHRQKSSK